MVERKWSAAKANAWVFGVGLVCWVMFSALANHGENLGFGLLASAGFIAVVYAICWWLWHGLKRLFKPRRGE